MMTTGRKTITVVDERGVTGVFVYGPGLSRLTDTSMFQFPSARYHRAAIHQLIPLSANSSTSTLASSPVMTDQKGAPVEAITQVHHCSTRTAYCCVVT
jgi:hypothetical protein